MNPEPGFQLPARPAAWGFVRRQLDDTLPLPVSYQIHSPWGGLGKEVKSEEPRRITGSSYLLTKRPAVFYY